MPPTTDLIQATLAVATFLGTCAVAWWRITARLHSFVGGQTATLRALEKLRQQMLFTGKRVSDRVDFLASELDGVKKELSRLTILMDEREKDILRLEGQVDHLADRKRASDRS